MSEPAAFCYWFIPDERRPGRMIRTSWRMTEETAKGYPGAVRDDSASSKEVRHHIGTASDLFKNSPPGRIGVSEPEPSDPCAVPHKTRS